MKLFTGVIPNYPVTEDFYVVIKQFPAGNDKWMYKFLATNGYSYKSEIESIFLDTSEYPEAVKQILLNIKRSYLDKINGDEDSPEIPDSELLIENVTEIVL